MSNYQIDNSSSLPDAFRALANPHRLHIYSKLRETGPAPGATGPSVGELGADMDIALSTLSHHLRQLQQAGLVHLRRQGKRVYCSIDDDMLVLLSRFFSTDQS